LPRCDTMVGVARALVCAALLLPGGSLVAGGSGASCEAASGACLAEGGPPPPGVVLLQHGGLRSRTLSSLARTLVPRRRTSPAPGDDVGVAALLETSGRATKGADGSGLLPLCHNSLVRRACGDAESLTKAQLQEYLSANASLISDVFSALSLPSDHASVGCSLLCWAAVAYVRHVGGVLPPASDIGCYTAGGQSKCNVNLSPTTVAQQMVQAADAPIPDAGPGLAWNSSMHAGTGGLVRDSTGMLIGSHGRSVMDQTRTPIVSDGSSAPAEENTANMHVDPGTRHSVFCAYSVWGAVERIAALFRFFPSSGRELAVSSPPQVAAFRAVQAPSDPAPSASPSLMRNEAAADDVRTERASAQEEIAISDVRAKAWVSMVLTEMAAWKTEAFRTKWFGGAGELPEASLRAQVKRTMNFIERELLDGVRYVYPADEAVGSSCSGSAVGYVWKWVNDEEGHAESTGPVCSADQDPFLKQCGVGSDGKYFVYLCRRWLTTIDGNARISALIHEAAHHAGPSDISYDKARMQSLGQAMQLDNIANYQNFAQEVAQDTSGCTDSDEITGLPFQCTPAPCACSAFGYLCDDDTHGPDIRRQCPATCGGCHGPSPAPSPALTSAPTTLAPATPAPCEDDPTYSDPEWHQPCAGWLGYDCTGYAFSAALMVGCPMTCTGCGAAATPASTPAPATPAPTPPHPTPGAGACTESVAEQDVQIGEYLFTGTCTAFEWKDWCFEPNVKTVCPITCGVCAPAGCADSPSYSVKTNHGVFTCEAWKGYKCWEEVLLECPMACGVPSCKR